MQRELEQKGHTHTRGDTQKEIHVDTAEREKNSAWRMMLEGFVKDELVKFYELYSGYPNILYIDM
jgi:hypothetical protein